MATAINTMPYNRDAEMALLGCLLIDSEIAADIVEKLKEDDFYQESHKYILRAMQRVFLDRKPVDLVTVSDELESEGSLEKAGGIVCGRMAILAEGDAQERKDLIYLEKLPLFDNEGNPLV